MPEGLNVAPFKAWVASKSFSGGHRSALDIAELLNAQPEVSLSESETQCQNVALSEDWNNVNSKVLVFLAS